MKKTLTKIVLGTATFLAAAYPVFAQINIPGALTEQGAGAVTTITVPGIIQTVIRIVFIAAFVVAFIILLVGGIRWMTAGGDPKNVEGARNMVTAGLIGLVIVLAAFALIRLIETIFGVDIIRGTITIPTISS